MKLLNSVPEGTDVLLHLCCAPDASYGVPAMQERFRVSVFFFNPNIHPQDERERRIRAVLRLRDASPFPLRFAEGGEEEWETAVRGLSEEPEKGRRCEACIRLRLARTAAEAVRLGHAAFGTVLTVSPKKDAVMVNRIGREEGERAGIPFVEADMKKEDGFRKSVEISRRLGIYRQNYCGCRYSLRPEGKTWRKREGIEPTGDISASRPDLKSGGATSAPSASVRSDSRRPGG